MDVRGEYLKNEVLGASKEDLLMLLLEGGERFIRRAQVDLAKRNMESVNNNIIKAQNIYLELFCVLEQDTADYVPHLQGLYYFLYDNLLEANVKKDAQILCNCLKAAEGVTAMWRETVDKYHSELRGSAEKVCEAKNIDIKG